MAFTASIQIKGWQVRKRPIGMRPRIAAVPSVANAPNERWSTDLCRVWAGRDGWTTLALVIDCHTRELLGWHLSRSGKATTAASALEHVPTATWQRFSAANLAVPVNMVETANCGMYLRINAGTTFDLDSSHWWRTA
ncbi:hypothetical protein GCM10011452_00010 [Gemmobacter lanyuensis]|uniref:Integrase catalytic domain-containing protein n=3 Tax=Gemmobacter lanyuensis TaxID=1054497 RepID=A0A918MFF0_9RHOB|nr:hypothetical protein GCM10011452_00010 [Gemmobacter lanyuensis]